MNFEKTPVENTQETPVEKVKTTQSEVLNETAEIAAAAMETQTAEKAAAVEEKKKGLMATIKEALRKKTPQEKAQKFLDDNQYKLDLWYNQGYTRLTESDEEKIKAAAIADKFQGTLGVDQKSKIIRYRPTKEISYSGGTNSSGGPTAGA